MNAKIKILYLGYEAGDIAMAKDVLTKENISFNLTVVGDEQSFVTALKSLAPDIILAEDTHPGLTPIDALTILGQRGSHIPVIAVSSFTPKNNVLSIVNIMKQGAYDYIFRACLKMDK